MIFHSWMWVIKYCLLFRTNFPSVAGCKIMDHDWRVLLPFVKHTGLKLSSNTGLFKFSVSTRLFESLIENINFINQSYKMCCSIHSYWFYYYHSFNLPLLFLDECNTLLLVLCTFTKISIINSALMAIT